MHCEKCDEMKSIAQCMYGLGTGHVWFSFVHNARGERGQGHMNKHNIVIVDQLAGTLLCV